MSRHKNQNLKVLAKYVPNHSDAVKRIEHFVHTDFDESELDEFSRAPKKVPAPTKRITVLASGYVPVDPQSFSEECILYKGTMDGLPFKELVHYQLLERLEENWIQATIFHSDKNGVPLTFVGTALWINEPVIDPSVPNAMLVNRGGLYEAKLPLLQGVARQMLTKVHPAPKGKVWEPTYRDGNRINPGYYRYR